VSAGTTGSAALLLLDGAKSSVQGGEARCVRLSWLNEEGSF
jgi:hypothetical protein